VNTSAAEELEGIRHDLAACRAWPGSGIAPGTELHAQANDLLRAGSVAYSRRRYPQGTPVPSPTRDRVNTPCRSP